MPSTRIRAALAALAVSAVISSGALAGCSVSRDDEPNASASEPTRTPTPTATEEPTAQPSATVTVTASPEPSTSPTTGGPAPTPAAALLSAAELPQLNPTSRWTERRTGPAGQQPFGLCQKFDLLTIGAESVVERTFASGTSTAGQQVAVFPDAQNAVRASKVAEAWQRDCAKRVKRTGLEVDPISDVAVPRGKAWWYLASFQRGNDGHFHALGLVLSGPRLSLLRMDHDGQDHNYPAGQDPIQLAVKAVSARLG
ncbi:MAG: hypothetical protein JWR90_4258 [Marmoricola sp.]|jgi:hypothetical protein|nr:hypothetical protein [Marmoricola sp.]